MASSGDGPVATVVSVGDPVVDGTAAVVSAPIAPGGVQIDLAGRVQHMVEELDLPQEYIEDLLKLVGTDIIVIADDSGSMNSISDATTSQPMSRWQELQRTLRMLVTMLLVIEHSEGFWLKFLNDPQWYKVQLAEQLDQIFSTKDSARGRTPLLSNLTPIVQGTTGNGKPENDTLVLVLTDGLPSDCSFDELSKLVKSKPADIFFSFAMCTDEDDVVDMYNRVVDPIPGCDITDDFQSEFREARRFGNKLTPHQWLAKMLLVKFAKYDKLDEQRLGGKGGGCCLLS